MAAIIFNLFEVMMRILKIKVLLFLFFVVKTYSLDISSTPLKINFFGSIAYKSNMMLYGDCGTIYHSSNQGSAWEQINIFDEGEICKMTVFKDTLWCLSSNNKIATSIDGGKSWKVNLLSIKNNETCFNFCITNNQIFLRTTTSIISLDRDLKKKNSLSDTVLYYPVNEWPYIITSYNAYKFIEFTNNKLVLSIFHENRGKLMILSEDLTNPEIIDLKNYIKRPDWQLEWRDHFKYQNQDVWQIGPMLYKADSSFKSWKYLFSDSTVGNYTYDKSLNPFTYQIFNDNIYLTYRIPSIRVVRKTLQTIQNYNIGLKLFDKKKENFEIVGNLFNNDYFTIYPVTDLQDGISGIIMNNKVLIFNDSVFVCYGANKTILQTRNKGVTWDLISYVAGEPIYVNDDSTIHFCTKGYEQNEIFISNNKGKTFKPIKANYFANGGYLQTFSNLLKYYINAEGKGIIIGCNNRNSQRNVLITNDSGSTYNFVNNDEPYIYPDNMNITNLLKIDDGFLFGLTYYYQNANKYYNYLYKMNSDFDNATLIFTDSNKAYHHILGPNGKDFRIISTNYIEGIENRTLDVLETTDSGSTFTVKLKSKQDFDVNNIYAVNNDSLFLTTLNSNGVFLYDYQNNILDKLLKLDSINSSFFQIFNLDSKFYLICERSLFENQSRANLNEWELVKFPSYENSFSKVLSTNKWFITKFEDAKHKSNYYIFDSKKLTDADKIEIRFDTHFFYEPAYPIPAKTVVKAKIFWDLTFDIEDSFIGIFNMSGESVGIKEDIDFSNINQNSILFSWNCSKLDNGIYYIVFSYHGIYKSIPILITK